MTGIIPDFTPLSTIMVCSDKARHFTAERDTAIVRARAQGETLKAIAEAAGMTPPGVRRIVKRDGAP